ncbi:unnamed protein product [Callosobruchus maculatus]|uniref:Uncharacterized protein n=1 Tax=Callosobruchus maculatus TaxID=64391 RepID=A0A653BS14_CALMS|nr:unnamed protein product [Callosobruchus maculatus]
MVMDKWHKAFHYTKLGGVRCVLDKGQPLAKKYHFEWEKLMQQLYSYLSTQASGVKGKGETDK